MMAFRTTLKYSQENSEAEQANLVEQRPEDVELTLRRLRKAHSSLKRWTSGLVLLLILAIALLLAGRTSTLSDSLSRYPAAQPSLASTIVTFERNEMFASPSSPESDHAWGAFIPPGDGFVIVEDPEKYGIPPGKNTSQGQVYDVSMWHQIHCVRHIRTFLYTLKSSALDPASNTTTVWSLLLESQEDHITHCFDYLRQSIVCAGDIALEWPRTEPDGKRFAVDGWGIPHQCKSWESIIKYMDAHSVAR